MGFGLFQQGNHLLALDAGEAIEKILNGIACFDMIEKTLYGNPRSNEHRLATKNFRVSHDHFAHGSSLATERVSRQAPSPSATYFTMTVSASM